MSGLQLLLKPLPGTIHVHSRVRLSPAAAAFGLNHQVVGLSGIVIMIDDVFYFLLRVCFWVVQHLQQSEDVFIGRLHRKCHFSV